MTGRIAIVGLGCRFPGARNVAEYWENLKAGKECVQFFSDDELRVAGVDEEDINDPRYVKAQPTIADLQLFDAKYFRYTQREAEVSDPQHRLFLETAYVALEDSGRNPFEVPGVVGVFAGSATNYYADLNVAGHPDRIQAIGTMTVKLGNRPDYLAPTVSYRLGLGGPSVNVATACSTALVAVHLACGALRAGECDTAIAGGVEVELPVAGYTSQEGGIYSLTGHCRPFDSRADGTVFGTGVGAVVLRRLEDALRDGDHIYAVIRGSAVNNDAADKVGFTAPGVSGQRALVQAALDDSGVDPSTIGYVEAHGTGTIVGDPIEVSALSEAFVSRGWAAPERMLIGSVKGNVGHLGPAAGAAGLIKAALAVQTGDLPPSINFDQPNPKIRFEETPFQVNTELRRLPERGGPRRASVSSFGIGGTNAHVVIEQPPEPERDPAPRQWQVLTLSAQTEQALERQRANLAGRLAGEQDAGALADVAYTLATGRPAGRFRAAVVARSWADAATLLDGRAAEAGTSVAARRIAKDPGVVFVFPGQGAQHLGMAAGLYAQEPAFAAELDAVAEVMREVGGFDPLAVVRGDESVADRVNRTEVVQPALFAVEYALARLWQSWGVQPAAMIGHSIGELVAATVAGVFTLPDAARLAVERGRLMSTLPEGSMLALPVPVTALPELGAEVSVAAANAESLTVVSGPTPAVEELRERLAAQGVIGQPLRTSHAFHSAMMEPILPAFAEAVAAVPRLAPAIPVVSNVTADYHTEETATDPGYWAGHIRGTVRFADSVRRLLDDGSLTFLEVGPGQTLTSLVRRQVKGVEGAAAVPSLRRDRTPATDTEALAAAVATVWTAGVPVDWAAFHAGPKRRRVSLPTYPFDRVRCWLDPVPVTAATGTVTAAPASTVDEPRLGLRLYRPTWVERAATPAGPDRPEGRWLVFVTEDGRVDELVSRLRQAGRPVATVRPGTTFKELVPGRYLVRPDQPEDYDALFELLARQGILPDRIVHTWLSGPARGLAADAVREDVEHGFHSVLSMAQALARHAIGRPVHLDVVTTGVFDVTGEEPIEPGRAAVQGPGSLVPIELPPMTYRHIDLRMGGHRGDRHLYDELLAEATDRVVAVRGRKRWVLSHEELPVRALTEAPALLRERGTYLVTGGLGGIGLAVAEDLAKQVRATLVLMSRSPFPARETWDDVLDAAEADDPVAAKIVVLRRIEELGGAVVVVRGDIADTGSTRAAIEEVEAAYGPVHGVFHAAGVAGEGLMAVKRRAVADGVLRPKVDGVLAVHEIFGDRLDFVVLFSSIAAVAPVLGLSDYSGANATLDAYAHARAGGDRGGYVVSVNFGMWDEVGMANHIPPDAPTGRKGKAELPAEVSHPLIGRRLPDRGDVVRFATSLTPDSHWVLREHQISGAAVWPGTGHLELARAAFEAAVPVAAGEAVELADVVFMAPLVVTGRREVRVELRPLGGSTEFRILSAPRPNVDGEWQEHVRGSARAVPDTPRQLDGAAAWEAAVQERAEREDRATSGSGLFVFGPRWTAMSVRCAGERPMVAKLSLAEEYRAETAEFRLHPALLDRATALGMNIPRLLGGGGTSFLPFSYGRIVVHDTLPADAYAVVRYTSEPGSQLQSFDVALVDDAGRVVVDITGFALRAFERPPAGGEAAEPRKPKPKRELSTEDGLSALRQILTDRPGPQVVVLGESLSALLSRAAQRTSQVLVEPAPAAAPSAPAAAADAEPRGAADVIAGFWQDALGEASVAHDEDFFELGGNSLVAVQLGARIRGYFGVELPIAAIFENSTVRALADFVERQRASRN